MAASTVHGDLPRGDGLVASRRHEQELLALSGPDRMLDVTQLASLWTWVPGYGQGVATTGTPVGKTDPASHNGRSTACRRSWRTLVEQSIGI